ncbi:MAG: sugar kinase [Eubacteriales bacterium]|nr:sugar kinase [Eubacteriales bacterium]
MAKKIVTFGEIMLRLAPDNYLRFNQVDHYEATFGGAEANVCVSLSNYGYDTSFISILPNNDIAQCAINTLRKFNVNTDNILRKGNRIGIYFCEKGASERPSKVIYDRKGSSISCAKLEDFDWDKIFDNASWFHLTGITPALGENLPNICMEALKKAKEKNINTSLDLNYRKKLWSKDEAKESITKLCPYIDILISNEEDAKDVFGIEAKDTNIDDGKINVEGYKEVAKELIEKYHFEKVAITLRESFSANDNAWSSVLYDNKNFYISKKYNMHIVDRVGGGDAFAAGLISGFLDELNMQDIIEFASASSCLKHSIQGDFNLVSKEEVQSLVKGNIRGRVQR